MLSCTFSKTFNNNIFNKTPQINSNHAKTSTDATHAFFFYSRQNFIDPRHLHQNLDPRHFFDPSQHFMDLHHPRRPRQNLTHANHEPMHPRYPRRPRYPRYPSRPHYLADSCKDDNLTRSTNLVSINHPTLCF